MAASDETDVSELFQRMGEKLGWFKHKDMGEAFKTLSKSGKKKSTKSRITKDLNNDKENAVTQKQKKQKKKTEKNAEKPTSNALKVSTVSNKLSSFDGILSSDSDSSFTLAPEQLLKPTASTAVKNIPRQTLVLESDSDDEPLEREDTYVSCVGESLMESYSYSTGINRDIKSEVTVSGTRNPGRLSLAMNETILMKNRMSVGSLCSELDSFDEPLLESTRIHRQSSVGYRQMFEDIGESDEDTESMDGHGPDDLKRNAAPQVSNDKNDKQETHLVAADICDEITKLGLAGNDAISGDTLPDMTCNGTRFMSALDVLGETDESVSETEVSGSDTELIEVVDVAVQTDDNEHENLHPLCHAEPVLSQRDAYTEETVIENVTRNRYQNCPTYDQTTVVNISNSSTTSPSLTSISRICNLATQSRISADSYSQNSFPIQPEVASEYSQLTVNQTRIVHGSDQTPYEQNTVHTEEERYEVDQTLDRSEVGFEQQTVSSDICSGSSLEMSGSRAEHVRDEPTQNVEEVPACLKSSTVESESDESSSADSVYEVRDVATQTVETSELNNTVDSDADRSEVLEDLHKQLVESKSSVQEHEMKSFGDNMDQSSAKSTEIDAEAAGDISLECVEDEAIGDEGIVSEVEMESEDTGVSNSSDRNNSEEIVFKPAKNINFSESPSDSESEDEIARGFVPIGKVQVGQTSPQKSTGNQSWRDSRRYDSESSDDNLEYFFQNMRRTNKAKVSSPESEEEPPRPISMTDFIVEDDEEISSGSEDDAFYLRETQRLEMDVTQPTKLRDKKQLPAVGQLMSDSDDEEAFTSKLYPASVTKHKKTKKKAGSWSFSSDSNDDDSSEVFSSHKKTNTRVTSKKSSEKVKQQKKGQGKVKAMPKAKFDLSSSEDEEDDSISLVTKTDKPKQRTRNVEHPGANIVVGSLSNHGNTSVSDDDNVLSEVIPYVSGTVGLPALQVSPESSRNRTKGNNPCLDMSDSESEEITTPVVLFKTPNPVRRKTDKESNSSVFKTPKSSKESNSTVFKTPKSRIFSSFLSDDDEDDSYNSIRSVSTSSADNSAGSSFGSLSENVFSVPTPLGKGRTPKAATPQKSGTGFTYSFMKSLSAVVENNRRDPTAARFVAGFKKMKEEFTQHLFRLYNETVFENKLPKDLPIIWNKRLLRTAGYCAYKKHKNKDGERTARIELSTKVCDSTERVRDTLIHELCHAAVWLLNGVNGGHGPYWKFWARHSNKIHPELPAIGRCHSYSINTKFTYRCNQCGYSIGRHSKSLDTDKKVCGYCHGKFELIQNPTPTTPRSAAGSAATTPRTPNRFAMFVKDNYQSVKGGNKDLKHGDVMKKLSQLFAESKIST